MNQALPFGDVLRRYRKHAGLTQEELAERASLSVRAISDLERGVNHTPRSDTVALLIAALELSAEEQEALTATIRRRRGPAAAATNSRPNGDTVAPTLSRWILPASPTPLLGREHDEAAVVHLLRHSEVRLLTLLGPGGVGKTRLALRVAEHLATEFAGGVAFVPLADLHDAGAAPVAIAHALGLREEGSRPLSESLWDHLRTQQMLLLLDNVEQIVGLAPLVASLLAECPLLTLLVTSRATLRVRGEQEYVVPPLTVPDARPLPPVETLVQFAAVALFVERAQAARPNFTVTQENAAAIVEVCRRLDGLPLAIELAAPRVKLFTPSTLLARLELSSSRTPLMQVLTGGPRDLPARLQTLRTAIAWSYDLLTPPEQILFRRLAVFVGGCTLSAAEEVCQVDAVEGVGALVDQSLLRIDEVSGDEPRVTMLATLREYALEQLDTVGEGDAVRQAHAAHYLALVEKAEPALTGPAQAAWLAVLEREHANVRAALQWASDQADPSTGVRIAAALTRFWQTRGHLSQGRTWLEMLLAHGGAGEVLPVLRAKALRGLGVLVWCQGDYGRAMALHEESLALARGQGDTAGMAQSLTHLGNVAYTQSAYTRAMAYYEESLVLMRELDNRQGIASVLNNLGNIVYEQGAYERAAALFDESLLLHRALGNTISAASALSNLANVAYAQGDFARAAALHEESLAWERELGNVSGIAESLNNLGRVAHALGDNRHALQLYQDSRALLREMGATRDMAIALNGLGRVACALREDEQAEAFLMENVALVRLLGDGWLLSEWLQVAATVAVARTAPDRAARLWGAAIALREGIGVRLPPSELSSYEDSLATLRRLLGDEPFAAAWASGQALSPEQALSEALAGLPSRPEWQ